MGDIVKQIREAILDELRKYPDGIDSKRLIDIIIARNPDFNKNTIGGQISRMKRLTGQVIQIGPAKYKLPDMDSTSTTLVSPLPSTPINKPKALERDFYEPFRKWLEGKPENCKKAIVVGGAPFALKWSSPDVMGIRRSSAIHKFDLHEVISAEIKLDQSQVIVAFGQACSYRLFSHKSYVVIPVSAADQDERLDSLCMMFGIGMVVFQNNPEKPDFQIRVRASRGEVDVFEFNRVLSEKLDGRNTLGDLLF